MEIPLYFSLSTSFLLTVFLYYCLVFNAPLKHKLRRFILLLLSGDGAPPTYPLIGCLISFYNNRHRLLLWYTDLLSASPTQTVVIRRLGARKAIITANPHNVEYMLKINFINFPKGKPFTEILNDFLGNGIFNVDGELWHAQRKLASHQFTSRLMKQHVETTVKATVNSKLFPLLDSLAAAGETAENDMVVDLQEVLRRLGFDLICQLSLGFDPCCLVDLHSLPILKAFDTAGEISAKRAATPISTAWKMKKMLGIGSEKVLKDVVKQIHEYISEIIHEKRNNNMNKQNQNQNQDLLHKLIMEGVKEELIRDMVVSFIMAGKDTTSAAMTWLFYLLSRHPHVEEKLVNEIKIHFQDEGFENLREMKYLQACICETMRLYPPVSWDSKHALDDDVLPDGTPVKAGDRVTYFPYGMGRMESIWGVDRLEFRPDRWFERRRPGEGDDEWRLREVSPFMYPVFHAGPRVCLGKGMANAQMSYVVAWIVKRFEIRAVGSGEEAVYLPLLTAHMDGGFKVWIRRRRPTTSGATADATCQDKNVRN